MKLCVLLLISPHSLLLLVWLDRCINASWLLLGFVQQADDVRRTMAEDWGEALGRLDHGSQETQVARLIATRNAFESFEEVKWLNHRKKVFNVYQCALSSQKQATNRWGTCATPIIPAASTHESSIVPPLRAKHLVVFLSVGGSNLVSCTMRGCRCFGRESCQGWWGFLL